MIQLDDLRIVVAVAQQGSFVAAAALTNVPTSTVSRAVARFEEAVGARLFQRTSRKVTLTHEGARLLERAGPSLEELEEVIGTVSRDSTAMKGRLRVTAPMASGAARIGQALMAFAAAHPGVSVELQLGNDVVDLVEAGIDLAFRAGPLEGADLVTRKIASVPFAIGASRTFVAKYRLGHKRLGRAAMETLPAIVSSAGAPWRFQPDEGASIELVPRARFCVNDPRVAVAAARNGLGIVRAPRDLIVAGGLVALETEAALGPPEARALYAVHPSRRLVPKRVRVAIDWVTRAWKSTEPPSALFD